MIHDARLTPAAIGSWAVAAWVTQSGTAVGLVIAATAVVGAVVARIVGRHTVVVAGLAVAAVALIAAVRVDAVENSATTALAEDNGAATVRLRVVTDPREVSGAFGERVWFWASVTHLGPIAAERPQPTARALVAVSADAASPAGAANAGEWWTVAARFSPHDASRFAARVDVLEVVGHESSPWWWSWSDPVRAAIGRSAERGPPGGAALVPALVHGDESAQDDWTAADFQTSGLTHLLAVSGKDAALSLGNPASCVVSCLPRSEAVWNPH